VPSSCADRSRGGFSLIEVLVALAVIGLALGTAATVYGNGALGHEAARDADTALSLAQEKLAAAGVTETLQPGTTAGMFAGRFAWRLAVAPYDDRDRADTPPAPFGLYRIDATIAWRDGRRRHEIALETLRLARVRP